jgi:hypothetical protein
MHRSMTIFSAPLPATVQSSLGPALDEEHRVAPFAPADVRAMARRVVAVAAALGLPATVLRGVVDLGGAELDHVFVVVSERVVDVAMPMRDASFVQLARAWVAGDIQRTELVAAAAGHGMQDRVLGEYPHVLRYRGAPMWGSDATGAAVRPRGVRGRTHTALGESLGRTRHRGRAGSLRGSALPNDSSPA